jgi:hypothetical protein
MHLLYILHAIFARNATFGNCSSHASLRLIGIFYDSIMVGGCVVLVLPTRAT